MFTFSVACGIMNHILGLTIDGMNQNAIQQADQNFNSTLGGFLNPTAGAASDQNFGEKVLDFFTLGMYSKIQNFANNTIFALPTTLQAIGLIDDYTRYALNLLISMVYISAIVSLYSKGFNNISDDF